MKATFLALVALSVFAAAVGAADKKEPAMALNFSGTFVRSVTSKDNPAAMDLSRGAIAVLGSKMRFELDMNGRDPVFAEIYDMDKKMRVEVNLVEETFGEKRMTGMDTVDAILNAGLPLGKYLLKASADSDEMQCGRDTHYTVLPLLDDAGRKQWEALKAYMYICLSSKGIPSIAGVRTTERGQPWKNYMTLQNVKIGRATEDDFRAPKRFKRAAQEPVEAPEPQTTPKTKAPARTSR